MSFVGPLTHPIEDKRLQVPKYGAYLTPHLIAAPQIPARNTHPLGSGCFGIVILGPLYGPSTLGFRIKAVFWALWRSRSLCHTALEALAARPRRPTAAFEALEAVRRRRWDIVLYTISTIYYIPYTIYYILYTIYYVLYTIFYILYTMYHMLYSRY